LRQRLAAILAADVAGYSRLMAADDRATVAALDAGRAVFRDAIGAHGGRVIDMAGDSVLAVFEAATGAAAAALAIQQRINAGLQAVPEERRMRFRVGVNLGDVIEKEDGTVYGDGVNIAARLESLAEPGGIAVSASVHAAVQGRLEAEFEDRGEHQVKNIPRPVRAFRLKTGGEVAGARPAAPASAKASIAVLPFANLSGDPEQEYFADGIVDDLITALSRMRWFFVIARNSSFTYKGKAVDVKQVGRELGVRYVLEGSVRKSGNRVRISGQLVDAETGSQVWAERYEGSFDDIFELQDRITASVVGAVDPNVRRAEIERARAKPTANLQAYDLCLRALGGLMPGAGRAGNDEALALLRRAVEMDPGYTQAKALIAFACVQRMGAGYGDAEDVTSGLRNAEEALADHKDHPGTLSAAGLALASLGYRAGGVRVLGFRYEEALRAVERALALSPDSFVVLLPAGVVRAIAGDPEAALEHFDRAMRLSPLDPGMAGLHVGVGTAHIVAGRYPEAHLAALRALSESPAFTSAQRLLVASLGLMERPKEAAEAARRLLELSPGFRVSRYLSVSPTRDDALRERLGRVLREAGVPD
jgi:adenylate cyclase